MKGVWGNYVPPKGFGGLPPKRAPARPGCGAKPHIGARSAQQIIPPPYEGGGGGGWREV